MKFYAPAFFFTVSLLANSLLCAQEYDGAPISIGSSSFFDTTENSSWPYVITLAETTDGASSQAEQTLDINVTSLPLGSEYRVLKTMSNGEFFNGPSQALSAGSNKITIDAVDFDRTVKVQFSSGSISFDTLIVNAPYATLTIGVDDFHLLNAFNDPNNLPLDSVNLSISVLENGLGLALGDNENTSIQRRDAWGTTSRTFGQTGEWFDGSLVRFGNSGNQQILDFRITNNTGADAKLKNISFDLRRPPANANYATDFQLSYLAAGDSALIKGSSLADGSEMVNLAGIGSDDILPGINNFSGFIGQNISGTAWIADGGYANIRLKLNTTAPAAATQLDNLIIALEIIDYTAPNFTSGTTASSILENSGAGQAIYTSSATDASSITYSLKPVGDYTSFTIDEVTGVVTLIGDPDFESQSSYSFTVVATDGVGNFSELAVTLAVASLDSSAPTFISGTIAPSIFENSGAGQAIYTATATDASGVTYDLKPVGDYTSFIIDEVTGVVTLIGNPDYESESSYSFTVVATDGLGNSSEQVVTLFITDVDENAPTFISGTTASSIFENSGAGQAIYTATATDASGVTYDLKPVGDYTSFTIDEVTGVVTLIGNPDYESESSYSFTVVATDGLGNSSEQVVTLFIIDVDENAPTFISGTTASSIFENSGAGQAIYTATATDASGVTYDLKPVGDYTSFTIDEVTGVVTLIGNPDYESESSYSFTVVATDGLGNSSEQVVTLFITDVDDTAPIFTSGKTASSISENSGAGQAIYTATATDASGVTYDLKPVGDYTSFIIDEVTGVVTLLVNPDGTQDIYSFTVISADALENSSEQVVTLVISNDNTVPVFASGTTAPSIFENSGAGQAIYTATATDASGVTYDLKSVGDYTSFIIDEVTGVVTLIGDPDYESQSSYSFTVVATDGVGNFSELAVTLPITDLDDTGPTFISGTTASSIFENSGAGQAIYTATATDASGVTYDLKPVGDYTSFTIDEVTGVVTLIGNPDYESESSYSFTVVATDGLGNSSEQVVTLFITDVDENAPTFISGTIAPSIFENSGAGQAIYTATATDASGVTYDLKPVGDYTSFIIDEVTGVVTLIGNPDYESESSYSFTVVATDGVGNSSEQVVTLFITDVDENAPTFISGTTASSIFENSGAGQAIYTATATDASGVTYDLKPVGDYTSFTIDEVTGVVTLIGNPDYESESSYSFTVVATDGLGNSSEQVVTLFIIDVDENAPTFISGTTASSIFENSGAGQAIYTATATDASGVTYDLKPVGDYTSFTIDEVTGVVTLIGNPDYESESSYSFTVVATDGLGNSSEQAVTLSITDLDKYVEAGAVDIGNDWRWTNWLGYFNIASDPWIYHLEHKWIYIPPIITNFDSVFFWDNDMESFLWTSDKMYPELYRYSDGKWLWYLKESKDPRWFVNLATSEWEEYE